MSKCIELGNTSPPCSGDEEQTKQKERKNDTGVQPDTHTTT
jgi:hypothetical protein